MVDEGGRAEPELAALLPGAEHDAEVVLARLQEVVLLLLRELGDTAHQVLDLLVSTPVAGDTAALQAGGAEQVQV